MPGPEDKTSGGSLSSWAIGLSLLVPIGVGVIGAGVAVAGGGFQGARLALPPVPQPLENRISHEKRVLGKMLFWEEQLSSDHSTACGTCHITEFGGADPRITRMPGLDGVLNTPDDVNGSAGVSRMDEDGAYVWDAVFGDGRRVTRRSASVVINAAFADEVFWDGRASTTFRDPESGVVLIEMGATLESQVLEPPLDEIEMGHPGRTWDDVRARLEHVRPLALAEDLPGDVAGALSDGAGYPELFERAFGDAAITPARIAMAIATYERTLVADETPWDRFITGDITAMTPEQIDGWQRFIQHNCVACHTPPLFTNNDFHSTGLRPAIEDGGRFEVTGLEEDTAAFKTASLRNAGLKETFQHHGIFTSLDAAVDLYIIPARAPEHVDPILEIVNPTPADVAPISEFIRGGLTDPRVAAGTFPFDRPTLRSELGSGLEVIGGGTAHSGTDVPPSVIARTPPVLGSDAFRLGVHGVFEGESVSLRVSRREPVNGVVQADEVVGPAVAATGAGTRPVGTVFWEVPNDGRLDGAVYYFQFETGTGALSEIVRAELFCGTGVCDSACPADVNADFVLDLGDIQAFVGLFLDGDSAADLNGDGVLDTGDLQAFVGAYLAGC